MTCDKISQLKDRLESEGLRSLTVDRSLAGLIAYRIGGPADLLLEPAHETEIERAIPAAQSLAVPVTVIGNGTNLLVRDGGIRGLVIYMGHTVGEPLIIQEDSDSVVVRVPAACAKAHLLEYALARSYSGLEFSAGIPGSIGGAVYMNAGTKWGSYGEVIERVRLYSPALGFFEKTNSEMAFKYRGHGEGLFSDGSVVLSVEIRLNKGKSEAEIRRLVDEILTYRGGKQPLELPNCGSVFKNPAHSELGAGRLIEACGLKGHTIGDAQVSNKHANFILNLGHATAHDVESLIQEIQRTVWTQKKIQLETEVIILGER